MIQSNINRLSLNSFLVKGGSLVIVISSEILSVYTVFKIDAVGLILIVLPVVQFLFILGFWVLDAYFVRQERLFRHHYDAVRQQSDTDFNMYVRTHNNKPKSSWDSVIFSLTLIIFYVIEIVFILFLPAIALIVLIL